MKTFYVTENIKENISSEMLDWKSSYKTRSVGGSLLMGSPVREESVAEIEY